MNIVFVQYGVILDSSLEPSMVLGHYTTSTYYQIRGDHNIKAITNLM